MKIKNNKGFFLGELTPVKMILLFLVIMAGVVTVGIRQQNYLIKVKQKENVLAIVEFVKKVTSQDEVTYADYKKVDSFPYLHNGNPDSVKEAADQLQLPV